MTSPLLAGIPISSRFAEKLGIAQEKQDRQQMTYTKSSTQDREYSPAGFEKNLYEKSDIYHTTKDAITAPMRAIEGTLDVNSPQGVEEAMGTAGMGMLGSMPGGARGAGSLGVVRQPLKENYIRLLKDETPELYRETSGSRFLNMFGSNNPMGYPRWHFAETPEMALGQGSNKGLRFKVSTENLYGKVNRDKPALEQSYLKGMGEFLVDAQPEDLLKSIKEVEVSPEAYAGLTRGEKARLNMELSRLEARGVIVKRTGVAK